MKINKNTLIILCCCYAINTAAQELCVSKIEISSKGINSATYGITIFTNPFLNPFITSIAINGNFTIDNNFTINNKSLKMAPNTKIIVTAGNTLTISKSTLYSCGTQMWDGIEIQPGGNLVLLKGTWIEDAKVAVLSDNNGGIANFDISNTTFNRNYIGVKVENYTSSTLHPGIISRTTFDSRNSITSTVNTPLLDSPYDTQPAEIGVYLYVVNNVRVGVTTNPAAKNNFRYLKTGIYGIAAEYEVYNNDFRNNVPNGWAIVNTKSSKMIAGGNLANQPNNFQNISNGISHTSSSDLSVTDNTFTNINPQGFLFDPSTAIYTFECNNATIELSKNQLNNVVNGFYHLKNSYTTYYVAYNTFNTFTGKAVACIENNKGSIDVFQNQFTGVQSLFYSGNTAVYVAGTAITFPTSAVVTINENNINKINKGIHVVTVNQPIIENNNITFNNTIYPTLTDFYFGIRTQNCQREEIHLNTVDKIGSNPVAGYENALNGISVETSGNIPTVTENTVKKMGSGFRFRGFVGGANFRCNTMNNDRYGLVLDYANIGNQGEAPSIAYPNGMASNNVWSSSHMVEGESAVKGIGIKFSPAFYTRSSSYPWTPSVYDVSPINTILTCNNIISIPLLVISAEEKCQLDFNAYKIGKIPRLAKIARNENPFDQVLGNERFMMQEAVLRGVISDSLVIDTTLQDGRDLQMYIDTLALTNVSKLIEVTTLFARGDTLLAEAKNQSINPKECADAYHKMVNEIYFRTWAKNVFEFTPTDSAVLYNIAVQDPLVCGTAIYNARVMMNIDVNDYSVDPNGNRLMSTNDVIEKQAQQQLPKGKLYPNPSQHTVNYEINLAAEQVGLLVFYDLMGKEIFANQLTTGDNKLTIDVSKFQNGLYLYKVFINGKPQETGKFIIQH